MMKIDRYKERIDHMLFKIEFTEKLRHLSENMNAVLEASNALKESKALKELLNLILMMGNFLNSSSFNGGAFGIKIASINKVRGLGAKYGFIQLTYKY
ncbi:hypothetical protein K450DRAFT_219954 [Umbelopsis ramanniana AG]|uniref:FH2 domain-containing protein n=1 Tax=Umbelopsis ramanniana AG TaxID=1314678 RepID=A0AAD5EHS9_UMBRA|nr:uncharacterized protein K450DRAFT_219954 [Umbelopsis ramanniana AG]KAI8583779.1 hypothetical protein K450DRAFT_219954 [Umbelopsis ramanniana AG]